MKNLVYIFWVSALVLAGTAGVSAQESDRRDVRRGNREFRDGNYREAAVEYQKALLRDSTSFAASYNLANALYRMENWQEARSVLDSVSKAAEVSGHASDYWYNSGNTAATLKDWQAAVDAYKESLLRNPGDLEAKENYIYAKEMLENQQDDQQQDDQQQDDQQQDDRNDQDKNDQDDKDNRNDRNQDSQDNQDQDNQDQNEDQNDRNRDEQENDGGSGEAPQPQPQISKQAAQQMLNAIMAKEKETQDKVNKEKAAVLQSKQKDKNW